MEKIFKKSLAIMVSAAICLTALIGCLTVSAERGEGTITVGTAEAKAGESVTVPVELKYTSSQENGLGIAAALFDVKFDTNVLTITKIEREDPENDAIAYTVQWRTTDGDESSIDVRDGAVRILAVGKDETAVVPSMSLNLTFTVNAEAPAGASNITIENLQACDFGTADFEGVYANDEDMITMSATDGSVTVEAAETEDYLTYTGADYDIANSKLTVYRAAPSQAMRDVLAEANEAGNRKVQLVLNIDDTEFLFDARITTGTGEFTVSGFALPHMNMEVSLYIRVTADGDYLFNSNAYTVVLADMVAQMAEEGDAKAAALVDLNELWATTDEVISVDNAVIEEGAVDYTTISYDVKDSKLTIGRGPASEDLREILSQGTTNGNRKVQLVLDLNGTEFLFDIRITTGAGEFTVSGFALPHFVQDAKIYVRVTSGADGETVVNTNAVTVKLHDVMQAAGSSAFAAAYNTYYNAQ